jgi:hypothetical protein
MSAGSLKATERIKAVPQNQRLPLGHAFIRAAAVASMQAVRLIVELIAGMTSDYQGICAAQEL